MPAPSQPVGKRRRAEELGLQGEGPQQPLRMQPARQLPLSLPFLTAARPGRRRVADNLPPLGHMQDTLPITVDRGSIEFWVDDPCVSNPDNAAVVFAYASTIDQLSGDPTYQVPVLLADPKVIFAKKMAESVMAQSIGKRLSNDRARQIRDAAFVTVAGKLVRDASGYRITH